MPGVAPMGGRRASLVPEWVETAARFVVDEAMAWIESHKELKDHPKVADLMSHLNWDLDTAIGKLHRFWWWCVDYAPDGDLRKHNDDRIGVAVGVSPGEQSKAFVQAMVDACWLDRDPYFRVHDWWDYAGRYLQVRYKNDPTRWQEIRDRYKPISEGGCNNTPKGGCKNHKPTNQPTKPTKGAALDDEHGFAEFWSAWPRHHRKVGRPKCLAKWKSAGLAGVCGKVMAALERAKESPDWTKKDGEFIPQPMSWLNKSPWETDPDDQTAEPGPDENGFVAVHHTEDEIDRMFGWNQGEGERE